MTGRCPRLLTATPLGGWPVAHWDNGDGLARQKLMGIGRRYDRDRLGTLYRQWGRCGRAAGVEDRGYDRRLKLLGRLTHPPNSVGGDLVKGVPKLDRRGDVHLSILAAQGEVPLWNRGSGWLGSFGAAGGGQESGEYERRELVHVSSESNLPCSRRKTLISTFCTPAPASLPDTERGDNSERTVGNTSSETIMPHSLSLVAGATGLVATLILACSDTSSPSAASPGPALAAAAFPTLTPQNSGTTNRLQAVSPVNASVVWASGVGGTFTVTTNGGRDWHAGVVPGADELQFRDVEGVSADVAYLLASGPGTASRIYKI